MMKNSLLRIEETGYSSSVVTYTNACLVVGNAGRECGKDVGIVGNVRCPRSLFFQARSGACPCVPGRHQIHKRDRVLSELLCTNQVGRFPARVGMAAQEKESVAVSG